MPFVITGGRRGGRRLAALAASLAGLFVAAPAQAYTAPSNPYGCTPDATLSPVFSPWGDWSQYTPVDNQGLEDGATGWRLSGGASVVLGNEPWKVAGRADAKSLDLPAGSSAITPAICVDETYPYFRLFARNAGAATGSLKIEVLFLDARGNVKATKPFLHGTSSTAWQPTGKVNIGLFTDGTTADAAPIAFRFTPVGAAARYQIDDVFVDPWCR
jgi:hypothetical protein